LQAPARGLIRHPKAAQNACQKMDGGYTDPRRQPGFRVWPARAELRGHCVDRDPQ
jgi:hypothetical protein